MDWKMRTHTDAKAMAKSLREALVAKGLELGHSECLEIVAHQFGLADWNTLSARIDKPRPPGTTGIQLHGATPIFRIFSVDKAREFYVDWLGFTWDWTVGDQGPAYAQVSRSGLSLHLSEHHGDSTPGSAIDVIIHGIDAFHREISARPYKYLNPGINDGPYGRGTVLVDPFGNKMSFREPQN
jgi:hypothetical protein